MGNVKKFYMEYIHDRVTELDSDINYLQCSLAAVEDLLDMSEDLLEYEQHEELLEKYDSITEDIKALQIERERITNMSMDEFKLGMGVWY